MFIFLRLLGLNKSLLEGSCAEQLCVVPIFLAGNFLPSLKPKIVYLAPRNLLQEKLTGFFDGLA